MSCFQYIFDVCYKLLVWVISRFFEMVVALFEFHSELMMIFSSWQNGSTQCP